MSPANAKTLVFVSGGVLVGLALLSRNQNTYKRVWAAGMWTTALAVVADLAPQVVGPFALLVIVAAVAADQGLLGSFLAGNASAGAAGGGTAKLGPSTSQSSTPRASVTQTQGPRVT